MTPEEWSAQRVAKIQFEPEPHPDDVRGYVATLRDGSKLFPLATDKVSVASPRDIVACGHDGRPDETAAYYAECWPIEITVADAARQPWPVWLRTRTMRNGRLRPRLVLAEIDAEFVSTDERPARRSPTIDTAESLSTMPCLDESGPFVRLTLEPSPYPTEPGYDVLSCECGTSYEREEWARQDTTHGGCAKCARQLHHDDVYGAYKKR